ncbi:MAG TPA: hypothetical protein VKT81_20615 [Bryobacteraceae bacterium]|nr:hypothetical protein [Bryobacteraceae bacterium]
MSNPVDPQYLQSRLKAAVESIATPPFLEARIKANLAAGRRPTRWVWKVAPVAALGILLTGFSILYQLGSFRYSRASQDSYISSVSSRMAVLMRVGLGDHIHCAVFRKYPKNPPTMEQFIEKMGPQYSGILPIVREHVPADYQILMAHQCGYQSRRFVHVVLRNGSRLLSVVLTRKSAGEGFSAEQLAPALSEAGVVFYTSSAQRFETAAFESRDYAVYVISDLPKEDNARMMRAMAPQLKTLLDKLES